jgi:hypothetical protein
VITVFVVVAAVAVFVLLLAVEVYRAFKFSRLNEIAREQEAACIERQLINQRRTSSVRRRSSIGQRIGKLQQRSASRRGSSINLKLEVATRDDDCNEHGVAMPTELRQPGSRLRRVSAIRSRRREALLSMTQASGTDSGTS